MEKTGKGIKVFCLYEKQHELESFLNTAVAQTETQRYLVLFSSSTKIPTKFYSSFTNGFIIATIKVPQKITENWKKKTFMTHLNDLFVGFPKTSTRQNFFLDFTNLKVTKKFVDFVESSLESKITSHEVPYSIFSLFIEKKLGTRKINQLALNYPFFCLANSKVHPNFYHSPQDGGKFPSTLRDLYQPIQLLLEELEKNTLEQNRLNKELFMTSTQISVLESSLATFLEMEKNQSGLQSKKTTPADLISLSHYRDLKQRYDEKTLMLSTVSHDLKSPIAAIQGFAEILKDGLAGEVTPEMKKHLEMIVSNSKRLSRMVESIMEYERYDQSEYVTQRETFDLVEMIHDAKMSVIPQMILKDQEIRIYTSDSLEMVGNRELLLRVLQNVLDNAVKYSPPKKGKIELFAEEQNIKGRKVIKVAIRDNGFGFNEKNLKRVFEPFTRFEPGSTSTGLGLSIVHKIVEVIHGGSIDITSPGRKKGTTVTIFLPKT